MPLSHRPRDEHAPFLQRLRRQVDLFADAAPHTASNSRAAFFAATTTESNVVALVASGATSDAYSDSKRNFNPTIAPTVFGVTWPW